MVGAGIVVGFICGLVLLLVSAVVIGPSGVGSFVAFAFLVAVIYLVYGVTTLLFIEFVLLNATGRLVLSIFIFIALPYTVWSLWSFIAARIATMLSPVVLGPLVLIFGVKLIGTAIAYGFASRATATEPFWRGFLGGFDSGYGVLIGFAVHAFLLFAAFSPPVAPLFPIIFYLACTVAGCVALVANEVPLLELAFGGHEPSHDVLEWVMPLRSSSWSSMGTGSVLGLTNLAFHWIVALTAFPRIGVTTGGVFGGANPAFAGGSTHGFNMANFVFLPAVVATRTGEHVLGHIWNHAMFGGAFELVSWIDAAVAGLFGTGRARTYGERVAESVVTPALRGGRPIVPLWGN